MTVLSVATYVIFMRVIATQVLRRIAGRHSREIETVRRLWRGEAVAAPGGVGQEVRVRLYPRPVQPELPVWITAAATSNRCCSPLA